jgi:hypothetical protein
MQTIDIRVNLFFTNTRLKNASIPSRVSLS